ncbi:MAG: hypothetical protein JWO84_469 [Parcubacteria group bacterium]|nr:hypothetical protein [Parcubacteria group bacterium]
MPTHWNVLYLVLAIVYAVPIAFYCRNGYYLFRIEFESIPSKEYRVRRDGRYMTALPAHWIRKLRRFSRYSDQMTWLNIIMGVLLVVSILVP